MAHYHLHVKPGPKGKGADHAQYIAREGRFTEERYGEVGEKEHGNLPEWARGSAARFFAAADSHERANGNSYREFEIALPVELSEAERGQLVREFVAEQLGDRHAYSWAIHEPTGHNPHVHVMFSERLLDGTLRGPEQYFKRANRQYPERGGHLKSDWFTGTGGPEAVETLRARWADKQNQALERAGEQVKVDHRSLKAQGILEREAEMHRGPAVSGIEARGEVSRVSEQQRSQREDRSHAREAVLWEVKSMTREELAIIKGAARERRDLAMEVTGTDRSVVLKHVEADRREQLGRTGAMAERRVERRSGLVDTLGATGERLWHQARDLRERIGQQIGRVKEWVQAHFPDPATVKERSREFLNATVEKVRGLGMGAAARAQILKEAGALGRDTLSDQVQSVREEKIARQQLDASIKAEREQQREQALTLKLERQQALKREQDLDTGLEL